MHDPINAHTVVPITEQRDPQPTMHLWATVHGLTMCDLPVNPVVVLRYGNARLFCAPCVLCFHGVQLKHD